MVMEPIGDVRHVLQRLGVEQALDRAATRVSADDNIRHLKRDDRELDRRGYATDDAIVLRHDIARVAKDKQLPRLRVHEQERVDARIAARDDERLGDWPLASFSKSSA